MRTLAYDLDILIYNNPILRKIYLLINNSIYPNICTYSFKVSLNLLCTLNYDWLNKSLYKSKDNKFHSCGPCVHLKHADFFYFFNIFLDDLIILFIWFFLTRIPRTTKYNFVSEASLKLYIWVSLLWMLSSLFICYVVFQSFSQKDIALKKDAL